MDGGGGAGSETRAEGTNKEPRFTHWESGTGEHDDHHSEWTNVFFVGVFFQQAILVPVPLCRLLSGPGLEAVPAIIASPNYILI